MPEGLRVSVVMSAFNGTAFIRDQLESLARQTVRPAELVVDDDASTDDTAACVETFAATAPFPVRLVRHEVNAGWVTGFMRALGRAEGDLIAFCDQDDVWREDKLEVCRRWFVERPDLAMVVHAGRVTGPALEPSRWRIPDVAERAVAAAGRAPLLMAYNGFALVIPRWLRDMADPAGRPAPVHDSGPGPMTHDNWACFLASAAGPVAFEPEELVLYRRHGANAYDVFAPGRPGLLARSRSGIGRAPLGGERGVRGLFDTDVKVSRYRTMAGRYRDAASYLDALVPGLPPGHPSGPHLTARAAVWRAAAAVTEARAAVIGPVRGRARTLLALAADGGYAGRDRGGLGAAALPLDVVVAAREAVRRRR